MGPVQSPRAEFAGQPPGCITKAHRWHPGCRRCLLKGCDRWFLPRRPQARYCGPTCQRAARRWRRWHAARRYRATTHGKQRRRDQSRRYRTCRRECAATADPPPSSLVEPEPLPASDPPAMPSACEGQRPAEIVEEFAGLPCDRPGCYVLFRFTSRSPQQHFCSCQCRQALRRVRQREARLQQRRQQGVPRLHPSQRGSSRGAPRMSSRIEKPRC